jgi:glycosyltransferase involved in cell wall biosynthesis
VRVALVTNVPEDFHRPRGGVQSTAVALIRALASRPDIALHVIAANANVTQDRVVCLGPARLYYRRARALPVLVGALTEQRRIVTRMLRRLQPDIVHACDTSYFKIGYSGCPVLYQLQGSICTDTTFGRRFTRLRHYAWRRLEERALRAADAVLVNSPAVADLIAPQRTERVYVADEPVNAEFFGVQRSPRPCTVLFLGKLSLPKNPIALVRAIALLREKRVPVECRFVGAIDPAYAPVVDAALEEYGVRHVCTLLGCLSRGELIEELCAATVLAHPSLQEHAPAAISEAMVIGVPVVASAVGGIPQMVSDGETGFLVAAGNIIELATRLEQLLTDSDLQQRMSAAARAIAAERFSGEAAAARMVARYTTVCKWWHLQRARKMVAQ